jgi:translocation and assembly module TamB
MESAENETKRAGKGGRPRLRLAFLLLVLLFVAVSAFLRSDYVSDRLRGAVLDRVGEATGLNVTVEDVYLHVIPPYLGVGGVVVYDEEGGELARVEKVRGHVRLRSIFGEAFDIGSIVLVGLDVSVGRERFGRAERLFRDLWAEGSGGDRINVKAFSVREGRFAYLDDNGRVVGEADGIDLDLKLRRPTVASFSVREVVFHAAHIQPQPIGIKGKASITDDAIEIGALTIESGGSRATLSGPLSRKGRGQLSIGADVLVSSVVGLLGLSTPGQGKITLSGTVSIPDDLSNPVLDLTGGGDFPLETLVRAVGVSQNVDLAGHITFTGGVKGPVRNLQGWADASIENASFYRVKPDRATCKVTYGDGKLRFSDGSAEIYGGRAAVEVSIGIPHVAPYSVSVSFEDARSGPVLALIGLDRLGIADGRITGKIASSGPAFEPSGWFSYVSDGPGPNPAERLERVTGSYVQRGGKIFVKDVAAHSTRTDLALDGYYDLRSHALFFSTSLDTTDARDVTAPLFDGLEGRGSFSGTLSGTATDPVIEGNIRISGARLWDIDLGEVEASANYRKDLLRVVSARAVAGSHTQKARGLVTFHAAEHIFDISSPSYDLALSLEGVPLDHVLRHSDLPVAATGALDAEFAIRGEGKHPMVAGAGSIAGGTFHGRRFESARGEFSFRDGGVDLRGVRVLSGRAGLEFSGGLDADGGYEFSAQGDDVALGDLAGRELPVSYRIAFQASGKGSLKSPSVTATARLTEGIFAGRGIDDLDVEATLAGNGLSALGRTVSGDAVSFSARAEMTESFPWRAEVSVNKGRLGFLLAPLFAKPPEDLLLHVTGTASFIGDRSTVSGSATFDRIALNLFGQSFSSRGSSTVRVEKGIVSVGDLALSSKFVRMNVQGSYDIPGGRYDVTLNGTAALSPLEALSKNIESLRGDSSFAFGIRGDANERLINGGIVVRSGSLYLKNYEQGLGGIEGYVFVDNNRVVVEGVDAEVGGGRAHVSGFMSLKGLGLDQAFLDGTLSNVTLRPFRDVDVTLDGEMLFRQAGGQRDLSGTLSVKRASLTQRVEWKSWLVAGRRLAVARSAKGWADTVNLNITLLGTDNISVNNNIAKAPLQIEMAIAGTLASPELQGRIVASGGKVYFRNSELEILGATVEFSGPTAEGPLVSVTATTSIKGYSITLTLDGRLSQLDLSLSSDPPLEEEEILSLLTLGEYGQNLSGLEGGIGAAEATSLMTGRIQDVFESRVREITGVDRVQIDPYVSKETGTVTPRVTMSKSLGGEKLFVTYSASMGASDEQELKIEYEVTPGISVVGGRDDLGSLGGDVKFRFRFR